jgi:parallel beta-helix repeat protein
MNRTVLVIGIIFLLISASVVSSNSLYKVKSQILSFEGKTLYVGGSGPGNYSKIQEAIDNASDGDTVFVFKGIYVLYKFSISKSISLIGEDKYSTIIDGQGSNYVMEFEADFITLKGFTIQNVEYGGSVCLIKIRSKSNNNTIINNIFNNSNMYAISILGSNFNLVIDNIVVNCGWYYSCGFGIDCGSIHTGNIIKNNTLFGSCIGVWSATNALVSNNHVINNQIFVSMGNNIVVEKNIIENGTDIHIRESKDCIIEDNLFINSESITLMESKNIIVKNNTFDDSYGLLIIGDSIDFWNTHTIENNEINGKTIYYYKDKQSITAPQDASQVILAYCKNCNIENISIIKNYGIQLGFSSNNIICNNTIMDSPSSGIKLQDSSKNNISFNNIKGNKNYGVECLGLSGDNIFYNNSITNNYKDGILISKGSLNNYFINNFINYNHDCGIDLKSDFNNILNNIITDNVDCGIYCSGSNNDLSRNHLMNNDQGLRLYDGRFNMISQNNFINNSVSFYTDYKNENSNRWIENYYSGSNFFIKLIWGTVETRFGYWIHPPDGESYWVWICRRGINIDWHPAKQPYNYTTTHGCGIE